MPAIRTDAHRSKKTEKFWIRVPGTDSSVPFIPATDYIGQPAPGGKRIEQTLAMRVYDDVICFSLLRISKKKQTQNKEAKLTFPGGPLDKLQRLSKKYPTEPGKILLERRAKNENTGQDEVTTTELDVTINEAGVATITDPSDTTISLSTRGERLTLYMQSPVPNMAGRTIALGYLGHFSLKPGDAETIDRCAAFALNAALGCPELRVLSGIEKVDVPSRSVTAGITVNRGVKPVGTEIQVNLLTEDEAGGAPQPVAAGLVTIMFDLEHASGDSNMLLHSVIPSNEESAFAQAFTGAHAQMAKRYVREEIITAAGSDMDSIQFDITIGTVDEQTSDRVSDIADQLKGVDVTEKRYRKHDSPTDAAPLPTPAAPVPVEVPAEPAPEVPTAPVAEVPEAVELDTIDDLFA